MLRGRAAAPLVLGLIFAILIAIAVRIVATAGVPRPVGIAVAAVPLQPGRVVQASDFRVEQAYGSPALRALIREEEIPALVGGTVVMFVPQGAAVPRTAIVPPGQITAPGRLSAVMMPGELLMPLSLGAGAGRVVAPPASGLRPGDCLDVVAYFARPPERAASSPQTPMVLPGGSPAAPAAPAATGEITGTAPLTVPQRPLAKWIARVVVRSVSGLPAAAPAGTAPAAAAAGAGGGGGGGSVTLLLGIPAAAAEGMAYALGAADQVWLVLAPPCARAEVPPSPAFDDRDLEEWVRVGRTAAGPPAFFRTGEITSTAPVTTEGGTR
ncbi:MAG: hypothetical protein RQ897_06995 [Thermoflexus sp.]|jgi:hypothetical protein|nr:hypothetical protein [Thermoflexus sp.]MDT7948076.1 hypothetical protein [Thermoflexus sp.]